MSHAALSSRCCVAPMVFFMSEMDFVGSDDSCLARDAPSASRSSGSQIVDTSPKFESSDTGTNSPVSNSLFAKRRFVSRGSKVVPDEKPRSTKGKPILVFEDATMKSEASASSSPAPIANLCSIATTGFGHSRIASQTFG